MNIEKIDKMLNYIFLYISRCYDENCKSHN